MVVYFNVKVLTNQHLLQSNTGPSDGESAMSEGASADAHEMCGEEATSQKEQKCPLGEEREQMVKVGII